MLFIFSLSLLVPTQGIYVFAYLSGVNGLVEIKPPSVAYPVFGTSCPLVTAQKH